jgi:RNA polymerase sigma-70 factor (ECF subfamily)
MAEGPAKGLERLEAFEKAGTLAGHDRVAAARADLLRRAGRNADAVAAYRAALEKARNERERVFLRRRLSALSA